MRSAAVVLGAALAAFMLVPADAEAQQRRGQQGGQGQRAQRPSSEVTLVYEREVYTYRPEGRRDPFRPLTGDAEMGPRFESLSLQGIIYQTGRGRSIALLSDGQRVFRARVGDVIGNSTVVEIGPLRVVMAVENFGTIRQEMLELRKNQGANP